MADVQVLQSLLINVSDETERLDGFHFFSSKTTLLFPVISTLSYLIVTRSHSLLPRGHFPLEFQHRLIAIVFMGSLWFMTPVLFYFRAAALIFTYARCPTKSNVGLALSIAKRGVRLSLEVEVGLGRLYKAVLHI